jgi:hypothetical protein
MTLYEMATGTLPRWGDGKSDPALVDYEATIEAELFDPAVRERLGAFFGLTCTSSNWKIYTRQLAKGGASEADPPGLARML